MMTPVPGGAGPLDGLRVLELAGIGPAPFAAMLLAEMGAEVVRIERPGAQPMIWPEGPVRDPLTSGRAALGALDLKQDAGRRILVGLSSAADVLIEGFRPGVMEALGLGPDVCLARNPRLIYGRMTGWGQDGPLANAAGHDINYIAVAGVLGAIGARDHGPTIPLNLVGDFGGGGMLLAFGVLCALHARAASGHGQVVDAAMVDGAAQLATMIHGLRRDGLWRDARGQNVLDGGAPFYAVYETRDGKHVAVGALEPRFFTELLRRLDLPGELAGRQMVRAEWPELRARLTRAFLERTRDEWVAAFEGSDACVSPVLTLAEAPLHPHNRARSTFLETPDGPMPAPAPRFSESVVRPGSGRADQRSAAAVLAGWGLTPQDIADVLHDPAR